MTDRLTPREFVLARLRLAEVISGQAGKSSYSDREAAERVLQSGFVNLDALLPKPTQGENPTRAETRLENVLHKVHDRAPVEQLAQALAKGMEAAQEDAEQLMREPIGARIDGTAGPRTRVAMHLATMPEELVEALEAAVQAYKRMDNNGYSASWYREHPHRLAEDIRDIVRLGEAAMHSDAARAAFQQLAAIALTGLILSKP